MQNNKPNILFLSKHWYAKLFGNIKSDLFTSFHIANNIEDKINLLDSQVNVIGCFEEEYDNLPLSKLSDISLIRSFYPDRLLGEFSHEQRQVHLSKTITFFKNIFKDGNYDFIVHETIATEFDEVFSIIAKEHGIIDLTFLHSIIDNHFFWKSSPYNSSFTEERIDKIIPNIAHYREAKKYVNKVKKEGLNPQYIYKTNSPILDIWKKRRWRLIKELFEIEAKRLKEKDSKKGGLHEYMFNYTPELIKNYRNKIRNWMNIYFRNLNEYNDIEELASQQYLFFPLHFEPEASLLYFAPDFSEQRMVIQEILKALPLDITLVVKEHPQQRGMLLNVDFGELKKRNSNLIFLPAKYNTHSLIKSSIATITISGTTGYESMMNEVPTMVFGDVFYDQHPQVIKIKSFKQLREIFKSNSYRKNKPSFEANINYTAKILASSQKGFPNYKLLSIDQENARNLQIALEVEVKKYKKLKNKYYIGVN